MRRLRPAFSGAKARMRSKTRSGFWMLSLTGETAIRPESRGCQATCEDPLRMTMAMPASDISKTKVGGGSCKSLNKKLAIIEIRQVYVGQDGILRAGW